MSMYHVNPATGNPGLCKATKACPFGGPEDHFTSKEAAQKTFEDKQASQAAKSVRKAPPLKYSEFNFIEDLTQSKVIATPATDTSDGGYMNGPMFIGGKVVSSGRLYGAAVSKAIREDIKSAIQAGELPKDLSYNVQKTGISDFKIEVGIKEYGEWPMLQGDYKGRNEDLFHYETFQKVQNYLKVLGNQWATDDTNSYVDYYNSHNHCRVVPKTW